MRRFSLYGVAVAAIVGVGLAALGPMPIAGQNAPKDAPKGGKGGGKGKGPAKFVMPEPGPIPRTGDGQPDLNGIWTHPYTPDITQTAFNRTGATLKFTEWGQKNWDSYDASKGDYAGACLPFGLFRSMGDPHPFQLVQGKNWVALLFEQNTWFTKISTDGRPHPKDVDPTWFGDSRGTWKDDVLTIDTIGFNGKTRLDTNGHPHSDQAHVVETWKLMNASQVYYTMTITDPKTYTEPLVSQRVFGRITDEDTRKDPTKELMEYSCEENNKSFFEGRIKLPDYSTWK